MSSNHTTCQPGVPVPVFYPRIFLALTFLLLAGVQATAQSYVSGTGDDANTCGSADPCRSFTRALAVTPAAGTVTALAGDYEPFQINRAVSIRAAAGATPRIRLAAGAAAGIAIMIFLPRGDYVWLDGLHLVNEVSDSTQVGIDWFTPAEALLVTNCAIEGFGNGITFEAGGYLAVDQCIIRGAPTTFPPPDYAFPEGILLFSRSAGDPVYAEINGSSISRFSNSGLWAADNSHATLRDCNLTDNLTGVLASPLFGSSGLPPRGSRGEVTVEGCYIFRNGTGMATYKAYAGTGPNLIRLRDSYVYYSAGSSWVGFVCDLGANSFYGNGFHDPLPACP